MPRLSKRRAKTGTKTKRGTGTRSKRRTRTRTRTRTKKTKRYTISIYLEDKLKGLLYGGALGDALGAPHEFRHLKHLI